MGPHRMTAARGFARYLAGIYPSTEIPPSGLMPHRQRWRPPFIYSTADIEALMGQTRISINPPLRAATYETLVGLLAASGLRIGEAIKLDRSDIDWSENVLLIRESKFGKSRLVPLHSTAMQALRAYTQLRDELDPRPEAPSFFVSQTHNAYATRPSAKHSGSWSMTPGSGAGQSRRPGCTISATRSRSAPCSAGIAPARTCRRNFHRYQPTWATANRHPPIGISRPRRNCSPWQRHARTPVGRRSAHDADRTDPADVLHRPTRPTAPSKPTDHRSLPRCPEAAAGVHPCTDRQVAFPTGLERPGRGHDLRIPHPSGKPREATPSEPETSA